MINLRPMTGGLSQVLYASNRSAMLSSKIPQALAVHVWPGCTGIASVSVPVETIAPACSDGLCGSASSSGARPAAVCRAPARRRRLSLMACTNSSYVRRTTRWLRQIVRCATLRPIATGMQSIVFDPTHPNNLPFPVKRGARVPAVGLSASSGLCRYHQVRRPENPPPGTAACILADASDRTRADTFPSVIRLAFFPSRAPAG
jgi:hypothetical protein